MEKAKVFNRILNQNKLYNSMLYARSGEGDFCQFVF
jgi:hypothetical protein